MLTVCLNVYDRRGSGGYVLKRELQLRQLTRRGFGAVVAATPLLAQQEPVPEAPTGVPPQTIRIQRNATTADVPPFQQPVLFARKDAPVRVQPFPMKQVRLLPGPFADAQEWNRTYLHRLRADRLFHNFRVNAGMASAAEPLGGWEEPKCELRGHFVGHYLSACGLTYTATGDEDLKTKGDRIVSELADCQKKLQGGYLSAFPIEFFDRLKARQKVWAPFYTVHKIMAGMLDMYRYCDNQQALEVLKGMSAWVDNWTAVIPEPQMQDILNTEYGGMNEILYDVAAATKDDRWAKSGDRFTKKQFFNPLALRRDELRGLHVNTHIPQVIGAARRYELSSDMRFHDVADYFWYEVTSARAYVTGGTSNKESWLTPPRRLAEELNRSAETAECCCAYNMLKLTRHLYSWSGDPRYFDYYERTLLNHRLGTIYPKTGATMYFLSLTTGAWKTFGTEDQSFWCCTGTGVEEFSKLNDSIYFHDGDGVYVNLFIASELNWTEKSFRLKQETKFPEQAGTTLTVAVDRPLQMAVRIRVPGWVTTGGSVKLNGKILEGFPSGGSYLTLSRVWNNGDRIEVSLPMQLRMEAMPDDSRIQAILYGPVLMAGDLGKAGLEPQLVFGPQAPRPAERRMDVQTLRGATANPESFIKPVQGRPLTFQMTGQARNLTLMPLYSLFEKRYAVYWPVT